MNTARMTILMPPARKAAIEQRAFQRGMSSGEYARNALESYERESESEEADLAALVAEANIAIPKMRASIERIIATLDKNHRETDAFLKKMGIR